MKKINTLPAFILFALLFWNAGVFGQYSYEVSAEHPYGLPNPDAPKQIKDFDGLIGECTCTSVNRNPDQSWAEPTEMIWRWKYIMNGMAIQDETLKSDGKHSGSIRQYHQDSAKWFVHYYSSNAPSPRLPTWTGGLQDNGNIVLYRSQAAPTGQEGFYRLTFFDINEEGYKWVGEWVDVSESIVFPTWTIECKR